MRIYKFSNSKIMSIKWEKNENCNDVRTCATLVLPNMQYSTPSTWSTWSNYSDRWSIPWKKRLFVIISASCQGIGSDVWGRSVNDRVGAMQLPWLKSWKLKSWKVEIWVGEFSVISEALYKSPLMSFTLLLLQSLWGKRKTKLSFRVQM